MAPREIFDRIYSSWWWKRAAGFPDPHWPSGSGVTLADHLERTAQNVAALLTDETEEEWRIRLRRVCSCSPLGVESTSRILSVAALLHDIGKPDEDSALNEIHPFTDNEESRRHPLLGVKAAIEILPRDLPGYSEVLSIIDRHAIPFSWFRQFEASGQLPSAKAWNRLDRSVHEEGNGTGLLLLCVFKFADTDGHSSVADAIWFCIEANKARLAGTGLELPVPTAAELVGLSRGKDASG